MSDTLDTIRKGAGDDCCGDECGPGDCGPGDCGGGKA